MIRRAQHPWTISLLAGAFASFVLIAWLPFTYEGLLSKQNLSFLAQVGLSALIAARLGLLLTTKLMKDSSCRLSGFFTWLIFAPTFAAGMLIRSYVDPGHGWFAPPVHRAILDDVTGMLVESLVVLVVSAPICFAGTLLFLKLLVRPDARS
jgi:hypothetical protein